MNKLNLLLFASILSIQTPVINHAYAQDLQQDAIEEEARETQTDLAATDFQNMNEADLESIHYSVKKHIKKKKFN